MIVSLNGTLVEKDPTRIVIEACGVGYEVLIPLSTYDRLPHVGETLRIRTFHCVREDDEVLFGFGTDDEREMFVKLTSVSGVGPKIALAILSGMSVGELALSVTAGDAKRISAVKGVGKKTAEKICVDLRDKVNALALASRAGKSAATPVAQDAVAALRALGFNEETSTKMVTDVLAADPNVADVESVIRRALSGGKKG